MNIVETDYWCLMLPPEWSAEEEDGSVLITDQDGIVVVLFLCLGHPAPEHLTAGGGSFLKTVLKGSQRRKQGLGQLGRDAFRAL